MRLPSVRCRNIIGVWPRKFFLRRADPPMRLLNSTARSPASTKSGVGFFLPEIYRLRGVCLLSLDRNNKDEAHRAFATAVDIAKRQGAVIFEHRAEASFSELAMK